jgi:hypothetical protein
LNLTVIEESLDSVGSEGQPLTNGIARAFCEDMRALPNDVFRP